MARIAKSAPIPADAEDRIKEIAPLARLARRQHPSTDIHVEASKELTTILIALFDQGCSIAALARTAGMTYHSVSARIKAHA